MTLSLLFLLLAVACFCLVAAGAAVGSLALLPIGLAFFAASFCVDSFPRRK